MLSFCSTAQSPDKTLFSQDLHADIDISVIGQYWSIISVSWSEIVALVLRLGNTAYTLACSKHTEPMVYLSCVHSSSHFPSSLSQSVKYYCSVSTAAISKFCTRCPLAAGTWHIVICQEITSHHQAGGEEVVEWVRRVSARELWFGNCSKHSELCFAVFTFADLCIFLSYPSFVLLSWLGSVGVVKSPFR